MQSNKTSKKTNKIAEETKPPVPETRTVSEAKANPRTSTSSKLKKNETNEIMSAKQHRKVSSLVPSEIQNTESRTPTVTAAAGTTLNTALNALPLQPKQDDIAKLAYSYWIDRGYAQGSAEEDWLRAEYQLTQKQ